MFKKSSKSRKRLEKEQEANNNPGAPSSQACQLPSINQNPSDEASPRDRGSSSTSIYTTEQYRQKQAEEESSVSVNSKIEMFKKFELGPNQSLKPTAKVKPLRVPAAVQNSDAQKICSSVEKTPSLPGTPEARGRWQHNDSTTNSSKQYQSGMKSSPTQHPVPFQYRSARDQNTVQNSVRHVIKHESAPSGKDSTNFGPHSPQTIRKYKTSTIFNTLDHRKHEAKKDSPLPRLPDTEERCRFNQGFVANRIASIELFLQEVEDITSLADERTDDTDIEDVTKTPDDGELENDWLISAGYEELSKTFLAGREVEASAVQELTRTLTKKQREAVKKRVNTLNETLKKKYQQRLSQLFPVYSDSDLPGMPESDAQEVAHEAVSRKTSGQYAVGSRPALPRNNSGVELQRVVPISTYGKQVGKLVEAQQLKSQDISEQDAKLDVSASDSKGHITDSEEEDLPNYVVKRPLSGLVCINQMSSHDLHLASQIALLELTSLLDQYEITIHRLKERKSSKEGRVFGRSITGLLEIDKKTNPSISVPLVIQSLVHYLWKNHLKVEGLLRKPGAAARLKSLRRTVEEKFSTSKMTLDAASIAVNGTVPSDACSMLKQLLRELPETLLSNQYTDAFLKVDKIPNLKQQVQALNLLVILLPEENRNTLKFLLRFLWAVVEHRQYNKMSLNNVAMVMAPNLFLSASQSKQAATDVEFASSTINVMRLLIRYHTLLWTVPSYMVKQVRQQNAELNTGKKSAKKLGKRDKSDLKLSPATDSTAGHRVVRVQGQNLSLAERSFLLDEYTTAKHIVNKFQAPEDADEESSTSSSVHAKASHCRFATDDAHLYECGGNISELQLDDDALMLNVIDHNPSATLIVKHSPPDMLLL